MKAESTIQKEMRRLWRRKMFYEKRHGNNPGRCYMTDQLFGAYMALSWILDRSDKYSGYCPEYDEAKEKGEL